MIIFNLLLCLLDSKEYIPPSMAVSSPTNDVFDFKECEVGSTTSIGGFTNPRGLLLVLLPFIT